MRIEGLGRTSPGRTSAARAAAPSGGFHVADQTGAASAQASTSLRAAPPPSALLALQEVRETPRERRRRAMAQGRRLLDMLDELKLALLQDGGEPNVLAGLAQRINEKREPTGDAGLDETLDAIELRARVELAKRAG
jgi:hypothetical protein